MLWTLKKINPRLPAKVRRDYKHQLDGNTYLSIFQAIPTMLEDLEKQALTTQVNFEAFNPTMYLDGRWSRGRGAGGGGRRHGGSRGQAGQVGWRERPWYEKFCKVCQMATIQWTASRSTCPSMSLHLHRQKGGGVQGE